MLLRASNEELLQSNFLQCPVELKAQAKVFCAVTTLLPLVEVGLGGSKRRAQSLNIIGDVLKGDIEPLLLADVWCKITVFRTNLLCVLQKEKAPMKKCETLKS